jgi:branched-chain amino acid transport system ATP-binding protein
LAPAVVAELLPLVSLVASEGVAVILVEQSVNLALTVAETAYFMEKGEVKFHGPTKDLLDRPDVLRSVFLAGAASGLGTPHRERTTSPAQISAHGSLTSLAVIGATVRFGGVTALDDFSLSVAPGEILGLIGPNGAGKTTLFDLVSGFAQPDAGHVVLDGRDVTRWAPVRRARAGLGRSFQDAQLFSSMTVREAIATAQDRVMGEPVPHSSQRRVARRWRGGRHHVDRVTGLVETFGLGSVANSFVRELSMGTRRLVDLACLMTQRPSVVLLDEPTSGIAQRESEALAPLLVRLRDESGASLIVIEHDIALVTSVASRLVALDQGRLLADGPVRQVLDDPRVVDAYLGRGTETPMRSGTAAP